METDLTLPAQDFKVLIEKFIEQNLPQLSDNGNVLKAFSAFWTTKQQHAFNALCTDEKIVPEELDKLLKNHLFANQLPREQEIVSALDFKLKIMERKTVLERISERIKAFIDTFIEGMGAWCTAYL